MSVPARLRTLLTIAAAVAALGGGIALGVTLGERAGRAGHDELVIADPALATGVTVPTLRSAGGFTGFDGPGSLAGTATRAGTVGGARGGAFDVTSEGASLGIRTTSTARLYRIRKASTSLSAGDAVIVRTQADGAAVGVLRVPRDLGEAAPRPSPAATGAPGR